MEINKLISAAVEQEECYGSFDLTTSIIVIIVCCVLGLAWAGINFMQVRGIKVSGGGA